MHGLQTERRGKDSNNIMGISFENSLVSMRCTVCNETYKQPHILACLHSFCLECVEKLRQEETKLVKCPHCGHESNFSEGDIRPNYFVANTLTASILKELQSGNVGCGNCSTEERPSVFCEDCWEYLCPECVYCHENTKPTRTHRLISKEEYETGLSNSSQERAVFCRFHGECQVEEYCRSCQETVCQKCSTHADHNVVSLTEAHSVETQFLRDVIEKVAARVHNHENCASRCCGVVDELRAHKRDLSDKIRAYFKTRRERTEKNEQKLLEIVLLWYDKNFEMIKKAQAEEESRVEQITNALKLSQVVLKHGRDVEILSLKNLIESQLNRVASQGTGEKFIIAVEEAIRSASWDRREDAHEPEDCLQEYLKLPEVEDEQRHNEKDELTTSDGRLTGESWEALEGNSVSVNDVDDRVETENGWLRLKKVCKRRGKYGLAGHDYHVGTVISSEPITGWRRLRRALAAGVSKDERRQIGRDYRYDKILRNRSIGRQGSGCGEFQHPCDVVVDYHHDDRLIVSDYNNDRIQVFNYLGVFLFQFGSRGCGPAQLMGPTGVAVMRNGSIVVCDSLNNRVQLFTSQGTYLSSFGHAGRGPGEFWRPVGVAVDSEDRIIVVDQGNNRVQVFDSNGDYCFAFGKLGNWDGEVSCPNFVAVDKDDNIYVSDEVNMRIQIFHRSGTYLRKISSDEIHGCRDNVKLLSGIAVDSRGYIVVAWKNCCGVQVFTPDGRFLRTFFSNRANQSRLQFAAGIALTSAGEILVCDWVNDRIRFF